MSPAMSFGNWLRKVCPCARKSTAPLTEDEPEQKLSVIDQIVFNVLRDNEVTRDGWNDIKCWIDESDPTLMHFTGIPKAPVERIVVECKVSKREGEH